MFDNLFLDEGMKADLAREYEGTRVGRQELYGELLDDFEGALFKRQDLDDTRVTGLPELTRIIVGVDPAMKTGEEHDESGIVVAGEGIGPDGQPHAYILQDASMRGSPGAVMSMVASVYHKWQADRVVLEVNQGGDYVRDALRAVDASIPVRTVHARQGKVTSAEPVSLICEQGRLHLAGSFPELEDQLCLMLPGETSGENDDRADAMVWAMYELRHLSAGSYLDAYNMRTCDCGQTMPKTITRCRNCGQEWLKEPEPPAEDKPRTPGWGEAYVKTCDQGHHYPKHLARCDKCYLSPLAYLSAAKTLSEGGQGHMAWRSGGYGSIWNRGNAA